MPRKDKKKGKGYYKQYYLDNKEYFRQYNLDNKEKIKKCKKQYYLDNQEKIKEERKQYYLDNKEKIKQYKKQYYLDNQKKIKKWKLNNKEKIRKTRREYEKNRLKTDPIFKIIRYQRRRMRAVLKGEFKCKSTIELLGCSAEYCWNHLEQQFKPGMTRDNYGLWHVDHIIPCASFDDLSDTKQQKKCFHYTNLQPLWAVDNMKKGAKLDYETQY